MAISITTKFSGDVNTSTTSSDKAAATVDCGTVTNGAMLLITQNGVANANGLGWSTPSKSSGTATLDTITAISAGVRPAEAVVESVLSVWRVNVTAGGTLVLSVDDAAASFGYVVIVEEVAGHDTGTPITGTVTRATTSGQAADSTLSAAPATGDVSWCAIGFDVDAGTNSLAPGSGWSENAEVAANYTLLSTNSRTGSTSTTVDWPNATATLYTHSGVAFNLKVAASSNPTGTGTPTDVRDTGSGVASAFLPKQVLNLRLDTSQGGGDGKTETEVWLTWDAVSGAASYEVERGGSVIATGVATTTYHDTGRTANTGYAYRVRAKL